MDKFRELEIVCGCEDNNITLESLLKRRGFSRRLIISVKRTEMGIMRSGEPCRTVDRVYEGDIVRVRIPMGGGSDPEPNFSLSAGIAYEDEDYAIFDKPPGMPVHRSAGHHSDTLENLFAAEYPGLAFRPVNRLDCDTSGLVVAAKNKLCAAMKDVQKVYYAVCIGEISEKMRIDAPIGREDGSAVKRTVRSDGKPSATNITPLKAAGGYTLLEIRLETGRTHQIRVHLSHIGHPIAGDSLYGGGGSHISRQALHCGEVRFVNPVNGKNIVIRSEIPCDIIRFIQFKMP